MEYKAFEEFCISNKIEYKKNEPMKLHTSFKIGGEADYFVNVASENRLKSVIAEAKKLSIPYFVIGKGSNLLVSDKGIDGVVINLCGMDGITVNGNEITAFAGASLASVCCKAQENCLTGLEFAYGIPASVGGALYMNAGAYGGEMSNVVTKATFVTDEGESGKISVDDMALGYRTSIFKGSRMIITSVTFSLEKGDKAEIKANMEDFIGRRKSKQPLEYPSAGSTFKRPEGYFAGALIEQNGLKGRSVGGAEVSQKHAGFVINKGNATCKDTKELIKIIKDTVFKNNGVALETEVIFIGREEK